jgi:hypothetical protein
MFNSDKGFTLNIYIPIKKSSESTSATTELTRLIKEVSRSAPAKNETFTLNDFNLQNIIPNKPFFSSSTISNNLDLIFFRALDAIPLSQSTFDTLKKCINPLSSKVTYTNPPPLFYNSTGPNTTKDMGEGIYISCNPTGESEETTEVTYAKNEPIFDIFNFQDNPTIMKILEIIMACLIFILLCYLWSYIYKMIDGHYKKSGAASTPASTSS